MSKELDREEYLIAFGYALLVFALVSEPFVFMFTHYENIRMYGYLLFLIGTIILTLILKTKEVKTKNGM